MLRGEGVMAQYLAGELDDEPEQPDLMEALAESLKPENVAARVAAAREQQTTAEG